MSADWTPKRTCLALLRSWFSSLIAFNTSCNRLSVRLSQDSLHDWWFWPRITMILSSSYFSLVLLVLGSHLRKIPLRDHFKHSLCSVLTISRILDAVQFQDLVCPHFSKPSSFHLFVKLTTAFAILASVIMPFWGQSFCNYKTLVGHFSTSYSFFQALLMDAPT